VFHLRRIAAHRVTAAAAAAAAAATDGRIQRGLKSTSCRRVAIDTALVSAPRCVNHGLIQKVKSLREKYFHFHEKAMLYFN